MIHYGSKMFGYLRDSSIHVCDVQSTYTYVYTYLYVLYIVDNVVVVMACK